MSRVKQESSLSDATAAYSLMVLGAGCALFLLAQPREIVPIDLPGVVLPQAAVHAQLRLDAERARSATRSALADKLEALVEEHSLAEARLVEDVDVYRERRRSLQQTFEALQAEGGLDAIRDLQARAVERLQAALDMRLADAELPAVMGAFPELLAHNHAVRDGVELAPHFVLRTLYKARWNLICGARPIHGFESIERRAYFGWMGLQSNRLGAREQLEALRAYRAEGGPNARLALGVLLLRGGQYAEAVTELSSIHKTRPSLRLRNFLLSAQGSAEGP